MQFLEESTYFSGWRPSAPETPNDIDDGVQKAQGAETGDLPVMLNGGERMCTTGTPEAWRKRAEILDLETYT